MAVIPGKKNLKLNLGCGAVKKEGFLGVDWAAGGAADIVADLNSFPWPFEDSCCVEIIAEHLLEHIANPDAAMREIHRISAPDCVVKIITPHFSSYQSYGDMSHRMHASLSILLPYCKPDISWNSFGAAGGALFVAEGRRLTFGSSPLGWPGRLLAFFSPEFYEKYFAFMFPCRNIEFTLKANKTRP
ncbi:MAG: hypothetical protein PHP45_03700 [Elusimicrobiales bacterium]|nr:hypothetical protein [Elusimicrobiales bacterium]